MEEDLFDAEQEILCDVYIKKKNNYYIVVIDSKLGGHREYENEDFEVVLGEMSRDLQDEFESL